MTQNLTYVLQPFIKVHHIPNVSVCTVPFFLTKSLWHLFHCIFFLCLMGIIFVTFIPSQKVMPIQYHLLCYFFLSILFLCHFFPMLFFFRGPVLFFFFPVPVSTPTHACFPPSFSVGSSLVRR